MPPTKEQIELYKYSQTPEAFSVIKPPIEQRVIFSGREALVTQVLAGDKRLALKWYASLSGQQPNTLRDYAKSVNEDEAIFRQAGLSEDQVPNSSFAIADFVGNAELFAVQPWIQGRILKDVPLIEILQNRPLRLSLAELFEECALVFKNSGRFPDMVGGDKLKIGGREMPDPRKVVWPFFTKNIIESGNKAILIDARTHDVDEGSLKYNVLRSRILWLQLFAKLMKAF